MIDIIYLFIYYNIIFYLYKRSYRTFKCETKSSELGCFQILSNSEIKNKIHFQFWVFYKRNLKQLLQILILSQSLNITILPFDSFKPSFNGLRCLKCKY